VSVKKAKGKGKGPAKKSAKKSAGTKKGKDIVQVRENINELVKASARTIATEVIKVARKGQLASAKYLFEAIGLYPATEQTAATPVAGSLAFTLLKRMGLPTEPMISEEDEPAAGLTNDMKAKTEAAMPSIENEPGVEPVDDDGPGAD
jgi:ABC-type uncharacterized transport system ATPase subunit